MDNKSTCCEVTTMCGYSLRKGVIFVGTISTCKIALISRKAIGYIITLRPIVIYMAEQRLPGQLFISIIMLAHAVACVGAPAPAMKGFNGQPVMAVDMIFGLYSMGVSFYQILISLLLIWQAVRTKGDIFLCTLWHVSHLSIVLLYCVLFTAKTAVCFVEKQYFSAIATTIVGLLYNATFIYFSVVVNSFSYTIDEDIYY